jgi:hypothetical protein
MDQGSPPKLADVYYVLEKKKNAVMRMLKTRCKEEVKD